MRIVMIIVFVRPILSLSMPNNTPPTAPAHQERAQRDVVVKRLGPYRCIGGEQIWHRLAHAGDKNLPFEDVEYPAQRGNRQHQPLVAGDPRIPGTADR